MIRGLYASAAGMLSNAIRHEINSVNMANSQTPGYKARQPVLGDFQRLFVNYLAPSGGSMPVGVAGTGPALVALSNNMSQGPLQETGRHLDVAIEGPGFFVVDTPEGLRYTRAGDWRVDDFGRLVTAEGFPVMGETGMIVVGRGTVEIRPDGTVFSDDQQVGRLQLVDFLVHDGLERSIAGTFAATAASGLAFPAEGAVVRQGFLERANMDTAAMVVEMMAALRGYEASQQAIQVQNETLRLAVNELGRI